MIFFDYVFYRVCKAYMRAKSTSPEFAGASIVALMQCFNIVSVVMFVGIIRHDKSLLNKTFGFVLAILFLVINYIRYVYREGHSYKVMSERYDNERRHTTKGTLVLLYIIISTALFFGLAIYGGSQTS